MGRSRPTSRSSEYLVEEAYETVEAIETGDDDACARSSATCSSRWRSTRGSPRSTTSRGGIDDVADGIADKLVRRHRTCSPTTTRTPTKVEANWKVLKAPGEAARLGHRRHPGRSLPALVLAAKLLKRSTSTSSRSPPTPRRASSTRSTASRPDRSTAYGDLRRWSRRSPAPRRRPTGPPRRHPRLPPASTSKASTPNDRVAPRCAGAPHRPTLSTDPGPGARGALGTAHIHCGNAGGLDVTSRGDARVGVRRARRRRRRPSRAGRPGGRQPAGP